jgi:hypothetical protein
VLEIALEIALEKTAEKSGLSARSAGHAFRDDPGFAPRNRPLNRQPIRLLFLPQVSFPAAIHGNAAIT